MHYRILIFVVIGMTGQISCTSNSKPKEEVKETTSTKVDYAEQGQKIVGATFSALSSRLMTSMQADGVPGAAKYCNLIAYPLVDSLSEVHNATIRRTSRKIRNPKDNPLPHEKAMLARYETLIEQDKPLEPVVKELDEGKIAYYAPIRTMGLCLKCHGKIGETLNEEDYTVIKELYPEDEAIGYVDGDFRGIWSVVFEDGVSR